MSQGKYLDQERSILGKYLHPGRNISGKCIQIKHQAVASSQTIKWHNNWALWSSNCALLMFFDTFLLYYWTADRGDVPAPWMQMQLSKKPTNKWFLYATNKLFAASAPVTDSRLGLSFSFSQTRWCQLPPLSRKPISVSSFQHAPTNVALDFTLHFQG